MPTVTQSVDGTITPIGDVVDILIEEDNPGGDIFPFGALTWEANFQANAPDLGGTITPVGDLTSVDDSTCVPADFACIVEPVTEYDCVNVCEPIIIPSLPAISLAGVIIPIGTITEESMFCEPVEVGAFDGSETTYHQYNNSPWFK